MDKTLIGRLRDAASQAGHYGAWSGGVLLEQAADEIERLRNDLAEAVAALPQAVRNERERCAKLCDKHRRSWPMGGPVTADTIKAAILRA